MYDRPGEHSQQTNHYGAGCDHFGEPFMYTTPSGRFHLPLVRGTHACAPTHNPTWYSNNCEFDASGEILQHLFDNTLTTPSTFSAKGTYVSVSQKWVLARRTAPFCPHAICTPCLMLL